MALALIQDGAVVAYPYNSLREDNPDTGFPMNLEGVDLSKFGAVEVKPVAAPVTASEEVAVEAEPVNIGGLWQQAWTTRSRTADELAQAKQDKLAALAARRYESEVAGINFNGVPIPTDRQTCAILTGAYLRATRDAAFAIKFKTPQGTFLPIDAPTIIAVGDAVSDHVQACFDRESTLSASIKAARSFGELASIDIEAGWPA